MTAAPPPTSRLAAATTAEENAEWLDDAGLIAAVRARFLIECDRVAILAERAIAAGDVDALRRAAHGLRGAASFLGASAIADVAGELEDAAAVRYVDDLADAAGDRLDALKVAVGRWRANDRRRAEGQR